MGGTPGPQTISPELQEIAERARRYPDMVFNNLYHKINLNLLAEAYRLTRKDASPGLDKVTADEYAENLDGNLFDLCARLRSNRYVAPPVECVDRQGRWKEASDWKTHP